MTSNDQPLDVAALSEGLGPLAERLARLADQHEKDYEGYRLPHGLLQRVLWWCADKPAPITLSASLSAICVEWKGSGESIACRFHVSGASEWAGSTGVSRPYGAGFPRASEWACLVGNLHKLPS